MILGVGNDIIENNRIAAIYARHGQRFLQRIFAPAEISYCMAKADPAVHLAARFAAKEAFAKALGCGLRGFALKDIVVLNDSSGRPLIELAGKAEKMAQLQNIDNILVSLAHERAYSMATVVLEQNR